MSARDRNNERRVVNAFLQRYFEDLEAGTPRTTEQYQALFPGCEEVVAQELKRLSEDPRPEPEQPVEERIGHYEVLRELGRGGQGSVYLAHDTRLSRRVALKLLSRSPFSSDESRRRFEREARLASRLDDPGICAVYETGVVDGLPYIAMRFLEGETLGAKIVAARAHRDATGESSPPGIPGSASSRQPFRDVAHLIERVARSLHVAHEAGVIHRDIKPGNVMVTPEGEPVLVDFGLARAAEEEGQPVLTRLGDFFGTPAYMAPERFGPDPSEIDRTADVYSLGVVLYECLTLERPFEGATREAIWMAVREGDAPDPRRLAPGLPSDLALITATAMAKEPSRRYRTAHELAEDLGRFRTGAPILARAPSAAYRVRRFVGRHRVLVTGSSTVILILALATTFTGRALIDARRARSEEAEAARRVSRTLQVLEDVLVSPDPDRDGPEVTLLEVLESSSEEVIAGLDDEPEVAGRLMVSLGRLHTALGSHDRAEPLLVDAVGVLERELGARDAGTLAARHARGELLIRTVRYDDAERELLLALEGRRAELGPDHPDTRVTEAALGVLYREQGRYDEANDLLRGAADGLQSSVGVGRAETTRVVHELATLLFERGRPNEAEELWLRVVEASETELGKQHSATLRIHRALAEHYQDVGRLTDAEESYRRALDGFRARFGPTHHETLAVLNDLGLLFKSRGLYADAEALYLESLDGLRRALPEDHPSILATLNNLGRLYQAQGRAEEAEDHLRRAYEGRLRTNGLRHRETLVCMSNLGLFYETSGRLAEAEPLLVQAFELRTEIFGPTSRDTLTSLNNLAWFYRSSGDLERAEEMFVESWEVRREALGEDDPHTLRALLNLGDLVRVRGRTEEAEFLLRDALESFQRVLGETNPDTLTTMNQLVVLLRDAGRRDEAAPLARELVRLTPEEDPRLPSRRELLEQVDD